MRVHMVVSVWYKLDSQTQIIHWPCHAVDDIEHREIDLDGVTFEAICSGSRVRSRRCHNRWDYRKPSKEQNRKANMLNFLLHFFLCLKHYSHPLVEHE